MKSEDVGYGMGGWVGSHQDTNCAKPPDHCQKFESVLKSLGEGGICEDEEKVG